MKKIFFLTSCFIFCFLLAVHAQEGNTKIKIKVKDANGKLIEKEYDSEEAFRNDPELKDLGFNVEAENERVMVRSQGGGNRTVIVQQGDSEGGNASYLFQGGDVPFPGDSLRKARRQLREEHREEVMKRREAMNLRREEMRARREERRQQMQEMDVEMEEGTRIIFIQELSDEETSKLNSKKEGLDLNELRFYPNPGTGSLQLELEAKEAGPVEIKLMDANTSKVVYETTRSIKAGEGFKESIKLENHKPGWYRLQISQNNKMLNRKVIIK